MRVKWFILGGCIFTPTFFPVIALGQIQQQWKTFFKGEVVNKIRMVVVR